MGNALDASSRALWLMVRNDAGWWTASQLTHYWRPTFSTPEVQDQLIALHKHGFLERRATSSSSVWAYAVTPTCQPLPGLSLLSKSAPVTTTAQALK